MKIFFGTNRQPITKAGITRFNHRINPASPGELRFGTANLNDDGDISIDLFPETSRQGIKVSKRNFFDEAREAMLAGGGRDVLVFIHGYNVSFDEAIKALATMVEGLSKQGKEVVPILFSWPSDGSAIPWRSYYSDRDDAAASACALSRGFQKLAHYLKSLTKAELKAKLLNLPAPVQLCHQKIHLMVHSMGTFALSNALQRINDGTKHINRLWGEVILTASDEDEDILEDGRRLHNLSAFAERVSIYFNRGDLALRGSDYTKGNPARLGMMGPRNPRALPANIDVVDCSRLLKGFDGGFLQHSYYNSVDEVIADTAGLLDGVASEDLNRRYNEKTNHYSLKSKG